MARLNLHVFGDEGAPPLACLHGLGGHGERYAPLAPLIPGRRLLAPDLRGHGRSTWDPPWTTERHVADVLETLPDEPMDWLGFSYGGRIAAMLASVAPERVRRLVLLDPALTLPAHLARERADRVAEAGAVTYRDAEDVADQTLAEGTLFQTPRETLIADALVHTDPGPGGGLRLRVSPAMEVTAWSEMAREPPPAAPGIPTLVVTGAQSWIPVDVPRLTPERHVETGGGHSILWEDLEATAAAVAAFLP
jgi:lipase